MHWFPPASELDWTWTERRFQDVLSELTIGSMRSVMTAVRTEAGGEPLQIFLHEERIIYAGWREDPLLLLPSAEAVSAIQSIMDKSEFLSFANLIHQVRGLHVFGTSFQIRIWGQMILIPSGTSISYSELALRASCDKSVRAAANACAVNPLLGFVPCHRIVAKNGGIGGFRGGTNWKEKWLEIERKIEKEKL